MLLHTTRNQTRRSPRYHVDLAGLQAVCEQNYLRVLQVAPQGPAGTSRSVMLDVNGYAAEAHLEIREQTKYTTLLSLSLILPLHKWLPLPDLTVRLYHDVRMAEVITADRHRQLDARYSYPNPNMHQPDEKHQLNKLLSEWLQHCLSAGYTKESLL